MTATTPTPTAGRRDWMLGAASVLPLLVWWLGWYPGFLSSDSIDQLGQLEADAITNFHPAFHTISMWVITRIWDSPAAVTLTQVLVMAALLGVVSYRLCQLAVPRWAAVGSAWFVALLPAVGPTTITVWKDIALTLALLWVFAEMLALARQQDRYWDSTANVLRLGVALGLVWLYRHNGLLTVALLGLALAVVYRAHWRRLLIGAAAAAAVVVFVVGPVFVAFDVDRRRASVAELLIPDVAAVVSERPDSISAGDAAYLSELATFSDWAALYDCDNSNPILFSPDFDKAAVRRSPGDFIEVAVPLILSNLPVAVEHRWCVASYLVVPPQPDSAFLARPPFGIPTNGLGIERDPVFDRAYDVTLEIFQAAEPQSRLWLTWRPALPLWLATATYGIVAWRRRWPLLWPGALLAIHTFNIALSSITQEFRFVFPIYLMSWLSLPLLWPAFAPASRPEGGYGTEGRSAGLAGEEATTRLPASQLEEDTEV